MLTKFSFLHFILHNGIRNLALYCNGGVLTFYTNYGIRNVVWKRWYTHLVIQTIIFGTLYKDDGLRTFIQTVVKWTLYHFLCTLGNIHVIDCHYTKWCSTVACKDWYTHSCKTGCADRWFCQWIVHAVFATKLCNNVHWKHRVSESTSKSTRVDDPVVVTTTVQHNGL